MGFRNLERPSERHIGEYELNALAHSGANAGSACYGLNPNEYGEAEQHVAGCAACRTKVSLYRQLVSQSKIDALEATTPEAGCPADVDWDEVAAGLWPERKATQLISHAALCAHCGSLLRAATAEDDEPTPQEEKFLAELKVPSCPALQPRLETVAANRESGSVWCRLLPWKVFAPAAALIVMVATLITTRPSPATPISGFELSRFAVNTHTENVRGELALDVHADSETGLNEWLKTNTHLPLILPVSSELPVKERPDRLEGARLVRVRGKTGAYIAYRMQAGPVGLLVVPDSAAVASGGIEASFKKVSFHYAMVDGYRVVTWSVHGLTYALVSQERNDMQSSCMVCHSAMRDRDLSHTPSPLSVPRNVVEPIWQ